MLSDNCQVSVGMSDVLCRLGQIYLVLSAVGALCFKLRIAEILANIEVFVVLS